MRRRTALAALAAAALARPARAAWPDKPVRVVVPFGAGGPTDLPNRLLAERLRPLLGQAFVLDFRPGAGGNIGAEAAARAAPDGHTALFIATSHAVSPSLYRAVSYDVLRDFDPVTRTFDVPAVLLANPALPARSVAELVALAKARPGRLNYGSPGSGGTAHLIAELFKQRTGTDIANVTYRGGGPAMAGLLADEVQVMFELGTSAVPQVRAGALRALAVTASARLPALPGVPTFAEAGLPGLDHRGWGGWVVPAGTPGAVVERLQAALVEVSSAPELRERLAAVAAEPATCSPEEFGRFLRAEVAKYAAVVRANGLTAE